MSRLFDLEDDVLKARKKGNQRTSQAQSYDYRARPSNYKRGIVSERSRRASYATPLGIREEIHFGEIIKISGSGGLIRSPSTPNVDINFVVHKNLIGFTDPNVNNKKLFVDCKMNEIITMGTKVCYKVQMDGDTVKDKRVYGATLDLMGPHDAEHTFKKHYIVEIQDPGKFGIVWSHADEQWRSKALPVSSFEWNQNSRSHKMPPRLRLKRATYPHISGVALRRYETPTSVPFQEKSKAAEYAMQIVRPGSHYIALKDGEVMGHRGFHFSPGDRFVTPISVKKEHKEEANKADKLRNTIKKQAPGDAPQEDPRHVGLHHPNIFYQYAHRHYCMGKVYDDPAGKWWTDDAFADLIEALQAKGYASKTANGIEMWTKRTKTIPMVEQGDLK